MVLRNRRVIRNDIIIPIIMQELAQDKEDLIATDDWVDLGLPSGLLWATRNVGATSPEDYGNYFAWGETQPKSFYHRTGYQYRTRDGQTSKYFTDNLTTLQPGDDAATVNLGGGARTPTKAEWEELINRTTTHWTTLNGVNGRILTGSNGNRLFLSATGYRWGNSLCHAGYNGYYWSNSLYTNAPYGAWGFRFVSVSQYVHYYNRILGFSVRAVRQK